MKKKRIQTLESRLLEGGEKEKKFQTEGGGGKKGQKVEKECSGWTTGGLEHQDGAGRP